MKRPPRLPLAVLALLAALALPAAGQLGFPDAEKASYELFADRTAYDAGATARLAAVVTIEDHWHVNSHTPSFDYLIPTDLTLTLPEGLAGVEPRLAFPAHKLQKFAFSEEPIAVYDGTVTILVEVDLPADLPAGDHEIGTRLRYQACDDKRCLPPVNADQTLVLRVGPDGEPASSRVFATPPAAAADASAPPASTGPAAASLDEPSSLGWILFLAMVGGLILNAMPCVLPVLSLKIFSLVKSAGQGRSQVVTGSLATAGGILISFWVLAGALVAALGAGAAAGWGVQFQEPGFVAFLAVVIVLFTLNMWGVFEILLPPGLASALDRVSRGAQRAGGAAPNGGTATGLGGHFVSGLFATLMATPCSAPYLGPAVGFAVAQDAVTIFAVFTAIGIGLALPYLLLAVFPAAARWLPKPGPWMVTFRGVMGFLLAAAAVWLFFVLAGQISSAGLAFVQLGLLAMALCVWLSGRAREGSWGRRLALVGVLAAAAGSIALAAGAAPASRTGETTSAYHDWVAFDEIEARRLADAGRFVFVDVTADWCMTCKTTERLVLETEEVAALFAEHEVVPMKADWTNRDDRITAFLARYGRAAVPFYVLYRPHGEPVALGEILTTGKVRDALR